jgi:16S rRNA (cytidine1402-2'-O)-methyltransferase
MKSGILYIVSTPIGNLEDITYRAVNCLKSVDIIAAEDTRTTRKLLERYQINPPVMLAYEEHSPQSRLKDILGKLMGGIDVALVSEGGTPLISDPGYRLVSEAVKSGIKIEPIPGASSILAALVISGAATDRFTFAGFPPPKQKARKDFLRHIGNYPHTVVLFESPHRIVETLSDISEVCGDRNISICRELTKIYEECITGIPDELLIKLKEGSITLKGEFVLVFHKTVDSVSEDSIKTTSMELWELLTADSSLSPSKAASVVAKLSGVSKQVIYDKYAKK